MSAVSTDTSSSSGASQPGCPRRRSVRAAAREPGCGSLLLGAALYALARRRTDQQNKHNQGRVTPWGCVTSIVPSTGRSKSCYLRLPASTAGPFLPAQVSGGTRSGKDSTPKLAAWEKSPIPDHPSLPSETLQPGSVPNWGDAACIIVATDPPAFLTGHMRARRARERPTGAGGAFLAESR